MHCLSFIIPILKQELMDLKERRDSAGRHPWEKARLKALEYIVKNHVADKGPVKRILDVGCGDAFITTHLFKGMNFEKIDGIDINLSQEQLTSFTYDIPHVQLHNTYDDLGRYDLVVLTDVIEHIEDDRSFLSTILGKYLVPDGYALITVPAFQSLYGSHDVLLGHYRRYTLRELAEVVKDLGLARISGGYLFFSLLPLRMLQVLWERYVMTKAKAGTGVGNWRGGKLASSIIGNILTLDSYMLMKLSCSGIIIPGLSAWILCRKH